MANADIQSDIIDYAMPMMKLEQLLRQVHDHCLKKEYMQAAELCPSMITEVRVLSASLVLMGAAKK